MTIFKIEMFICITLFHFAHLQSIYETTYLGFSDENAHILDSQNASNISIKNCTPENLNSNHEKNCNFALKNAIL